MNGRFEIVTAAAAAPCQLAPGTLVGQDLLGEGQWGLMIGYPGATALVVVGRRAEILAVLDKARAQVAAAAEPAPWEICGRCGWQVPTVTAHGRCTDCAEVYDETPAQRWVLDPATLGTLAPPDHDLSLGFPFRPGAAVGALHYGSAPGVTLTVGTVVEVAEMPPADGFRVDVEIPGRGREHYDTTREGRCDFLFPPPDNNIHRAAPTEGPRR